MKYFLFLCFCAWSVLGADPREAILNSWAYHNMPANIEYYFNCWSAQQQQFVAVAFNPTNKGAATSVDGTNWFAQTTPTGTFWVSVAYSPANDNWVAVGTSASPGG